MSLKTYFVIRSYRSWARKHVSTQVTLGCEYARHVDTWPCTHTRHVGTWARKHAKGVGAWARKARNLADSNYDLLFFNENPSLMRHKLICHPFDFKRAIIICYPSLQCWVRYFLNWVEGLTPNMSLIVGSTGVLHKNICARWRILTIYSTFRFTIQPNRSIAFCKWLETSTTNTFLIQFTVSYTNISNFRMSFLKFI